MSTDLANTPFEEIQVGTALGEGTYEVTATVITEFAQLLGYDDPIYLDRNAAQKSQFGDLITPPGMSLVYGLKLGWELNVFPPGAIRMGDDNVFYKPSRPGDVLTTRLTISDKFTKVNKKNQKTRKFFKFKFETVDQAKEKVCDVEFTAIVP